MRWLWVAVFVGAISSHAHADVERRSPELPKRLDLEQTMAFFYAHGIDLLIAETDIESSTGDVRIAGAIPNPSLSLTYGHSFLADCLRPPCTAPPPSYTVQLTDQAAIEGALSGKRRLRIDAARSALSAARFSRVDIRRTLAFQVKSQFEQVLIAQVAVAFAHDTADVYRVLLDKTERQAVAGKLGDADVLRVRVAKLEADQAVDEAVRRLSKARAQLAFLLGVRTAVPELVVEQPQLEHYELPVKLAAATHDKLLETALETRPDLHAQEALLHGAEAQLALSRRQRFPDVTLSLGYAQQGTNELAVTPPTFSIGLAAPIPVLYQQQGEIQKAEAKVRMLRLQVDKLEATIVSDFEAAYADFVASQAVVRRMEEGSLLATAAAAKDAVLKAKEAGAASLLDVLVALATYIATKGEYAESVARYWTAVFELELAVGAELR